MIRKLNESFVQIDDTVVDACSEYLYDIVSMSHDISLRCNKILKHLRSSDVVDLDDFSHFMKVASDRLRYVIPVLDSADDVIRN